MKNTLALLERARLQCDPPTWYQVAKRTGIATQTLSRCLNRNGSLDNKGAFALAQLLDMQPADVIAYLEEDRAKNDESREFWRRFLPRLLPAAGLALGLITTPAPSAPAAGNQRQCDDLYIMRTRHRRPFAAAYPRMARAG
jgi:hypothetical protein